MRLANKANLFTKQKLGIYNVVVISKLFYGTETLMFNNSTSQKIKICQIKRLRQFGILRMSVDWGTTDEIASISVTRILTNEAKQIPTKLIRSSQMLKKQECAAWAHHKMWS